jgi:hypothetical protein
VTPRTEPRPLAAALAATLAALALALAGCGHGGRLKFTKGLQPRAPLAVRLALVGPVALRWDEPSALLSYVRAQEVAGAIAERGQLAVLGPGQLGPGQGGAAQELDTADLHRVALRQGLKLEEVLLFKPWAERRVAQSAARLTDAKGKAAGSAAAAEVTLVAHLEVSHPATHALLVEVQVEGQGDPLAEHSPLDAHPELAALLREATQAALEQLGPALRLPEKLDLGLVAAPGAGPAMSFASRTQRALREVLHGQDELAQDLAVENALALWAPDLEAVESRALRRAPVSLLVREASGRAAEAGLRRGDLILGINGAPASRSYDLLTALRLAGAPLKLTVRRGAEDLTLTLAAK